MEEKTLACKNWIYNYYKPTGDKDDHLYRHLKDKGVIVGSFVYISLQMLAKWLHE